MLIYFSILFVSRLSLQDYLDKYDTPENRENLVNVRLWVQNTEYLNKISEVAERRRSRSGSQPQLEHDENMNPEDPVENLLIEDPRTELEDETSDVNIEKSKPPETLAGGTTIETKLEPLDVSETVNSGQGSSEKMADTGLSSPILRGDPSSDAVDVLTLTTLPPQAVDNKTKVYLKPPMSPELMIAIAVRNLDPNKEVKYCHTICIFKLDNLFLTLIRLVLVALTLLHF